MGTQIIFNDFEEWLERQPMPKGKRQVLLAGLKLFSQQGFDKTYTSEIAEASGMSEATIFKYFKTKDNLLLEIIKPIIENLLPEWGENFQQKINEHKVNLQQLVHFIIRDRFNFLNSNVNAVMVIFNEVMINATVRSLLKQSLQEKVGTSLTNTFMAFKATADFNQKITLSELVQEFIGQMIVYFLQCYKFHTSDPQNLEEELNAMENRIYKALTK